MLADLSYRFQKTKFLNLLVPVLCRSFLICRVTANQALLPFVVTEVSSLKFKQSFQPGLHDVLKLFILSRKRTAKLFLKNDIFYHKLQITIKQDSYTKGNESGEEAKKEIMKQ